MSRERIRVAGAELVIHPARGPLMVPAIQCYLEMIRDGRIQRSMELWIDNRLVLDELIRMLDSSGELLRHRFIGAEAYSLTGAVGDYSPGAYVVPAIAQTLVAA